MSRIPKSLRPRLPRVRYKSISGLDAEIDILRPTNASLTQLVRDNNIHGARRVWLHLNALKIPVERNTVFVQAALFHLENPHQRGPITSDMLFIDWLKLVPNRHQAPEWQKPFQPILEQLLRNSSPKDNALLLVRFAVLAASKGYLQDIWQPVIATMLRLPKPVNALFYFKKLEDAALEYDKKHVDTDAATRATKYRAMFIEACALGGWVEEAVDLVHRSNNIRITPRTKKVLIRAMKLRGNVAGMEAAMNVIARQAREYELFKVGQPTVLPVPDDEFEVDDLPHAWGLEKGF